MRAILISVDYADLLAISLPYNRHHFSEVMVVTSPTDLETQRIAAEYGAKCFATASFYADGAVFNKWKALEEGLDVFGRHGWLCIMDADVLWPKEVKITPSCGNLYTPFRRMADPIPKTIPTEIEWGRFPLHRQEREFAGYSQIFHADDPYLGPAPWHETNWRHAGGADSFFQAKWPDSRKVRPDFEVLHLGPSGVNWCGRASTLTDGTIPEGASEKIQQVRNFIRGRGRGPTRFDHEKLP